MSAEETRLMIENFGFDDTVEHAMNDFGKARMKTEWEQTAGGGMRT